MYLSIIVWILERLEVEYLEKKYTDFLLLITDITPPRHADSKLLHYFFAAFKMHSI